VAKNPDSTQFSGSLKNVVIAMNAIGAGEDILIALAMMYFLGSKHSEGVMLITLFPLHHSLT
jgi:hypothetical protein